MITVLLKKSKKKKTKSPKTKASFCKSKGKEKEDKNSTSEYYMAIRITLNMKILSLLLKNQRIQKIIMPRR